MTLRAIDIVGPHAAHGPNLLRLRSDDALVTRFRAGDADAYAAIVTRYRERLIAYARRVLNGSDEAEDVIQDVFLRAHRALLADDRAMTLKPWLYRIAHNRCMDVLRAARAAARRTVRGARVGARRSGRCAGARGVRRDRRRHRRPTRSAALGAADPRARRALIRGPRDLARHDGRGGQVAAGARAREPGRSGRGPRGGLALRLGGQPDRAADAGAAEAAVAVRDSSRGTAGGTPRRSRTARRGAISVVIAP